MSIPLEEVRRLARLAHLEYPEAAEGEGLFSDEQLAGLQKEITEFLEHVADLQSVDVEGVPLTAHGVPVPTRLRNDVSRAPADLDDILAAAPASEERAFMVPKVVE